jgi:hypothetical protein
MLDGVINQQSKHKELDKYLKHWFGMFTTEEKKDWVDNNTDLLEILETKEKDCIKDSND